jgi:Succinyl-CoA ligase like flavodoxin domain
MHLPFNFSLLSTSWHALSIARLIAEYEAALPAGGWPNWVLGNHERRLRDIGRRYGVRVLGPSSIGVVNVHEKLVLTANAAFAEPDLPAGGVFVGSHSGSLIGALVSRGKARGLGFAGLVSAGGEVDLSLGEICAATLDDPNAHVPHHATRIRRSRRPARSRPKSRVVRIPSTATIARSVPVRMKAWSGRSGKANNDGYVCSPCTVERVGLTG